jgi:hypothetical protein
VSDERNLNLDVRVDKFDAFIEGRVNFENDSPVENVTVALQNRETLEIFNIRTDQNGRFKVGLEAGHYVVTTSQYYSRYLGNHYWPDGFYAEPAIDTLEVTTGQIFEENIIFRPYPVTIRGVCTVDGHPLSDVLVQGIAIDPRTNQQQLYQTFSKSDGSYALGLFPKEIKSVIAQKEGFIAAPLAGFHNININEERAERDYNFKFTEQLGLMKLSGSVFGAGSQPLADVYVVAYNIWDNSPDGHLITKTDADGRYYFDIKVEGDWQVGVFKEGAQVRPELYYKYMSPGLKYKNLNFVVSAESDMKTGSGQLLLSDFNLLPHLPDPFFKETVIDFVLPKSSHTQVEVLSLDGHELTTLLDLDLSSGYQKLRWDGTDETGNTLASGVYLCRIKAQKNTTVLPITLLR